MPHPPQINCILIAAGDFHDIDFARVELLKLLGAHANIRTRVFEDYENLDALKQADMLVSYTCNVLPSEEAQRALIAWVEEGGRFFALHGTNTVLEMLEDGLWDAPRVAPDYMKLLGSQFISHPPIAPYTVKNRQPHHALVKDIKDFEVEDELYHLEIHPPLDVYLEAECDEVGRGFKEGENAKGTHPVFYSKARGDGAVLYLTLGHCRGHYDLRPLKDWWPSVDRHSWNSPIFYELLRRGLDWAMRNEG